MSNVFSMHEVSAWNVQITNEQICMIFITNAWNVKFMMSTIVMLNKYIGGGGGTWEKKINHKKI